MITLGIETSCDETGVALVKDGKKILANVVATSLELHRKFGGVIPEIASRMQLESIAAVFWQALKQAKIKPQQLDLIAVTIEPGLLGSLLVGRSFAQGLALSLHKPLIGVNHVQSHIYANMLEGRKIKFPGVALVVSGGHTSIFYLKDFTQIKILGQTQDDACGEAFDKVGKIMHLGYPGGPLIEKLARQGNKEKIRFACSGTNHPLNFSFSGIKTAVLYYLKEHSVNAQLKQDVAASFQESAINVLIKKAFLACEKKHTKTLLIGGGVVANRALREKFLACGKRMKINCFFPRLDLCMDNAAMVAGLGGYLYKRGIRNDPEFNFDFS